mgnify:CR=1 FL=1
MSPSSFVPTINEGSDTYKGVWAERDEAENFSQKHDQELIKEEKRLEVCLPGSAVVDSKTQFSLMNSDVNSDLSGCRWRKR